MLLMGTVQARQSFSHLMRKWHEKSARCKNQVLYNKLGKDGGQYFKVYGMNSSRLSVLTSTKLITSPEKVRYHHYGLNHTKYPEITTETAPLIQCCYKIEEFKELYILKLFKCGKQIILMYDVLQAIEPPPPANNVTREMFKNLTAEYEKAFLTTQFRIRTTKGKSYTSDDYINGIKYLLYKDTGLLDSELTNFNPNFNRQLFSDKSPDAYFGYVAENPLHRLIDWLDEDMNFNPEHINRVLAGLVEDWKQSDGKNPSITHWHEGDITRRWNSTQGKLD